MKKVIWPAVIIGSLWGGLLAMSGEPVSDIVLGGIATCLGFLGACLLLKFLARSINKFCSKIQIYLWAVFFPPILGVLAGALQDEFHNEYWIWALCLVLIFTFELFLFASPKPMPSKKNKPK